MKPIITFLATAVITTSFGLFGAVTAHEVKAGDLEIIHAYIPEPSETAQSAAGYMSIVNDGPDADRLIGVEVGFAEKAMLHISEISADGIATMTHSEGFDIPAGDTLVLEPGSNHLMLMGLVLTLSEGDMLPATLIFEKAGPVKIEFKVDPADSVVDHSTMSH